MGRRKPSAHTVHTKHPRYTVNAYDRGQVTRSREGQDLNVIPDTNVRFIWGSSDKNRSQEVWMSPEQYLSLVSAPPNDKISYRSLSYFDSVFSDGSKEIIAPYLSVDSETHQVLDHEGRHRTYWLMAKGVREIPVTIYLKKGRKYVRPDEQINLSSLKPDSGVSRGRRTAYSLMKEKKHL